MATQLVVCDTDVMIDFLDRSSARHEAVNDAIQQADSSIEWVVSVVTCMELLVGVANKTHQEKLLRGLAKFGVLHITMDISSQANQLMKTYFLSHGLDVGDAFIAATCIADELTLFTHNKKHYRFISGLKLFTL